MVRVLLLFTTLAALAVACAPGTRVSDAPTPAGDAPTAPPRADAFVANLDAVPTLNQSLAIVDPHDVIYDTFDGRFVPVDEASASQVRALRDVIRPIYDPQYQTADDAGEWMSDGDRVIGVEADGTAFAYPIKTLSFREIVNETFDGVPAVVTYCPLCGSGVVFDRRVNGETMVFGNTSALYDHDMVMYDHQTGSYWHQTSGAALVGELAGASMEPLASMIATFGEWRALHPYTFVLSNSSQQAARAGDSLTQVQKAVNDDRFFFPVTEAVRADRRLDLGTEVLLARLAGRTKAYARDDVREAPANDMLGGLPLVVFGTDTGAMAAYVARVGEVDLTFDAAAGGTFVDRQTGTTWDLAGRATAGELVGSQLVGVPASRAMWFSIAGANPDVALWASQGRQSAHDGAR